jgi:hypothetical protein
MSNYVSVTRHMLSLPRVQALLNKQQLQQVQQRVDATKACLAAKAKASAAAADAAAAAFGFTDVQPQQQLQPQQQGRKRKRQQQAVAEGPGDGADNTALPALSPSQAGDSRRQCTNLSDDANPVNAFGLLGTDPGDEQSASSDDGGSDTGQHQAVQRLGHGAMFCLPRLPQQQNRQPAQHRGSSSSSCSLGAVAAPRA